mgnify:CR=1 FL=1
MNNVSKSNTNQVGEQMTTTHSNIQRRCRRNEIHVNVLKMADGCDRCNFVPSNEAECRLLDLNHEGGGSVGAWAEKSAGKTADVSRLVWSGASLQRIDDELSKGSFLCKNCHAMEHAENKVLVESTEIWAREEIAKFIEKKQSV